MPITLRPALDTDRDFIRTLSVRVFLRYGNEYPKVLADDRFHQADHLYTLAEDDDGPLGFALVQVGPMADTADLHAIAVDDERHRAGVGRTLLTAVEAQARSRGVQMLKLVVAEVNDSDRAFFKAAGFQEMGVAGHFPNGQQAVNMTKALIEAPRP